MVSVGFVVVKQCFVSAVIWSYYNYTYFNRFGDERSSIWF